jgi:pimeloyl-ACP methyl ester carboxylesterase
MPEAEANGVRLYYELHGGGEPLALVHGSWVDATTWRFVVAGIAESFRVLVYDGHSRSERPESQGSVDEDGDDLAALLEALGLAPAHVVTSSSGGTIALRLATRRADVFRSLSSHEPPLWGLLEDDPESQELLQQGARSLEAIGSRIAEGDHECAARQFVDQVALGPGAWGPGRTCYRPRGGRSSFRTLPRSSTSSRIGRRSRSGKTRSRAWRYPCALLTAPRARPCFGARSPGSPS